MATYIKDKNHKCNCDKCEFLVFKKSRMCLFSYRYTCDKTEPFDIKPKYCRFYNKRSD